MKMPSTYETNIQSFIDDRKKIHLSISNPSESLGEWDDLAWGESPSRYRFTKHSKTNSRSIRNTAEHSITEDMCIKKYYLYFLKAYLSFNHYEKAKTSNRLSTDCHAFLDLCLVIEDKNILISEISQHDIESFFDILSSSYAHSTCEGKAASIINLISFLTEHKMLINKINCKSPFKYINSSHDIIKKREKKIPSQKVINAIADIYNKSIPENIEELNTEEAPKYKIALSIAGLLFSVSSRIGEFNLLSTSPIKQIKTDSGTTHSIIWRGSKGMIDHEKHIHKDMYEIANRSVNCLKKIGEKARILTRYYENPIQPLSSVIGDYKTNTKYKFPLSKPTTLWQLGVILGFYTDDIINNILNSRVDITINNKRTAKKFKLFAPYFPIELDSSCIITSNFAGKLLLANSYTKKAKDIFKKKNITIDEMLDAWINYIRSQSKNFPNYISPKGKSIHLSSSLIMINGGDHYINTTMGISPFYIRKPKSLQFFNSVFSKSDNSSPSYASNIFFRHGYDPKEFFFNSHQARHYLNTIAQRSDLPEEVIAAWSGRKSSRQNKVYNHETQEEIDAKFLQKGLIEDSRNIIPVTVEEFEGITGTTLASKTPTGFCTQSLDVEPCTYLQIGLSGCTGCTKHCYIKGDQKSLSFLKDDLQIQSDRVMTERMAEREYNPIMNKWFDRHIANIEFLNSLITLLERDDIPDGSIIQYIKQNIFNVITDGNKKTIEVQFSLPTEIQKNIDKNIRLKTSLISEQDFTNDKKNEFDLIFESLTN
ncbi:hypothetical protein [Endozoicomonas euniceicola]|uniref:Integrase n=1 Tax=Endozoicomonas euniceicola TaxID=1234143 RepID=A0ABY6GXH2_9GAMM|nr:hypothetical protein [Endozoicomonas euniceicola]UYM17079.1 hypothetical protein NX720_03890 [Endozoicomonas euniceicola]